MHKLNKTERLHWLWRIYERWFKGLRLGRRGVPHSTRKAPLEKPFVHNLIEPDNLAPINSILYDGLTVDVPAWHSKVVEKGDRLEVSWRGEIVYRYTIAETLPSFPISFVLQPNLLITDGIYPLSYSVTTLLGAQESSFSTSVKIDTRPPNHVRLGRPKFPPEIESGGSITQDYLDAHNHSVIMEVNGWPGMEQNQTIRLFWSDVRVQTISVTPEHVQKKSVLIVVPEKIIKNEGTNYRCSVYYILQSRAGVDGSSSETASAKVNLKDGPNNEGDPINILAPEVPKAANGEINFQEAFEGVIIRIPKAAYGNINKLDRLSIYWGSELVSTVSAEPLLTLPINVSASYELIAQVGSKDSLSVHYTILRNEQSWVSPPRTFKVDLTQTGRLKRPWIDQVFQGEVSVSATAGTQLVAAIGLYPEMTVGDLLTIRLFKEGGDGQENIFWVGRRVVQDDREHRFNLEHKIFRNNVNSTMYLAYQVKAMGAETSVDSDRLRITVTP